MGKGSSGIKKQKKSKMGGEDQNYGKVGRPKKKKENNEATQEVDKRQWFNVYRALQMLTLICEKGSLALRYKTGQKSNTMEESTKTKKSEETRKLKQKLKDLKKHCNYEERKLYLLIDNNTENVQIELPNADNDGIIEDMDKIYKYLDKEFQVSFLLILQQYLEQQEQDSLILAREIVQKMMEQKEQHKMLLNLALIKTNIEEDLEYVLQLANTTTGVQSQYEVNEKWISEENKIVEWLVAFIDKIIAIFKTDRQ
ncbi:unnamed protein product [Paramecium pentaurelia]|uniref:Uncharacterized protein n=1 Tax=Paramecium pentaurelia TaxID=43138 RepID=A0A8S1W4X0_9CILI|nr:unnamed protein product [Paramecium pentaurelia]